MLAILNVKFQEAYSIQLFEIIIYIIDSPFCRVQKFILMSISHCYNVAKDDNVESS